MFDLSLEAIAPRTESPLVEELTALFQTAVDLRDKLKETTQEPGEIIPPVIKHVNDVIATGFIRIVAKHVNLEIKKFRIAPTLNFMYAILMSVGSNEEALDIISDYTGMGRGLETYNTKPTKIDELRKLSKALDTDTVKFTTGKIGKKRICANVYFDPYTAFLVKECLHDSLPYMTAKELAAIMAHELGHMLSMVEHSADLYFRLSTKIAAYTYFTKYAPDKDAADGLRDLMKETGVQLEEPKRKQATKVVNAALAVHAQADNRSAIKTIGSKICILLNMFMTMGLQLLISPLSLAMRFLSGNEDGALEMAAALLGQKGKLGDVAMSKRNFFHCERLADEFVSQHGMGAPLASGMNKLHEYYEVSHWAGDTETSRRTSMVLMHTCKGLRLITAALGQEGCGISAYEDQNARLARLLENAIAVLKDQCADPAMLDVFIEDYESIKRVLKGTATSAKLALGIQSFWELVGHLASIDSWGSMLLTGHFSKEYEKLLDQTDQLMSNDLYYQAAKFDQLARRNRL